MKKKVFLELRYADDNAYCKSYVCNKHDLPRVGDRIFLIVSYGTVVLLKKVADNYYQGRDSTYDYYLCKVKE